MEPSTGGDGQDVIWVAAAILVMVAVATILIGGTQNLRANLQAEHRYQASSIALTEEVLLSTSAESTLYVHQEDLSQYKIKQQGDRVTVGSLKKDQEFSQDLVASREIHIGKQFIAPENLVITKTKGNLDLQKNLLTIEELETSAEQSIQLISKKGETGNAYTAG